MDAFLSAGAAALLTALIARRLHRRALRRRLAEYGRGHARLRELEADLRLAETRHAVALEAMDRERLALATRLAAALSVPAGSPRVGEPMLVLGEDGLATSSRADANEAAPAVAARA